ncbi:MAG: ABC transporter ATP-binding protein, partial [Spirochaetales bacterium]|nr:ABC transporter ATP-binding protein [Spirochaetales bacterium]
ALMQDARLLILDEPTSFLDYSNQLLVLERIGDLVKNGYSCIYSTHNPDLALGHSSRVIVMSDGRISYDGKPENLIGTDVLSNVYGRNIEVTRTERGGIVCIPV